MKKRWNICFVFQLLRKESLYNKRGTSDEVPLLFAGWTWSLYKYRGNLSLLVGLTANKSNFGYVLLACQV